MADIAGNRTTTAKMSLGETFRSNIGSVGDRDWVRIRLDQGEWVGVDLTGRGANPLDDPFLRIFDAEGRLVAKNDDGGDGLNASLTFRAEKTGSYFIEASEAFDAATGGYEIATQRVDPPRADASLYWGTQLGDPHVTVYFAKDGESFDGYTSEGFNPYEKGQFAQAFARLAAVSGLTFEIVADEAEADFRLVLDTDEFSANGEADTLAYFNPPGFGEEGVGVFNGAVWDRSPGGDLRLGGFGFVTIVHEVLHGLGLAHPHDDGGGSPVMPGVTRPFNDFGDFNLNQGVFTTMSYNSGFLTGTRGSAPTGSKFGYEVGPMAIDIAVLQALYGIGDGHQTGNTTFVLPDANKPGTMWRTIWDTAGYDRMVYDGSRDTTIDLRPATLVQGKGGGGFVSAADGVAGGFTIAHGVRIETALSGSGDDTLIGNGGDNTLKSRGGADILKGRSGADELSGGGGRDLLAGNRGADSLFGGGGDDTLFGHQGADILDGGRGADVLRAGYSNDRLFGGNGRDLLAGGAGQDTLKGGFGADRFVFTAVAQSRSGEMNRDIIRDFQTGLDTIVLAGIDANSKRAGNQSFDFLFSKPFENAGDLRIAKRGDDRLVQGDVDGDGIADFELLLEDVGGLRMSDFIL